jgi:hypothetical protein
MVNDTSENWGRKEKKIIIIMEHNHAFLKGKIHQKEKKKIKIWQKCIWNFCLQSPYFPLAPLPSPYIYVICTRLPLI